ncbi:copper resistance protein CopD [Corynebacterium sp. 4HC-13]|uniref:cytochrome c oxidase assembly protein n=1 Tax=Corynebacterium anserum TaxID=2684406 RepID=UPI00163A112B|nr:cytochrome c oxidase assembly protein [Corynebacterium anserum]MBC2681058.1 copper resistance protein CopD [Corynebacterium anserum]
MSEQTATHRPQDVKQPAENKSAPRMKSPALVYVLAAVLAGLVAAIIGYSFTGASLAVLGVPDPGIVTTFGFPLLRAAGTLVACIGVGGFLMSALGTPPRKDGYLDLDGFRASRTGTWAMFLWGIIALFMIPMSLSDVSGQPFSETLQLPYWSVALEQVSSAKAWEWVAIFAIFVAVVSLLTRKWIWQPMFLAISLLSLIPLALDGHSAAGGNHDYGVNSLLWHVLMAALWIGGLIALIAHAQRRGPYLAVITKRYSFLALCAIIALGLSGVVNASLRVAWNEWLTTGYGLVVFSKLVLTVALGVCGYFHRKKIIPLLEAGEDASGKGSDAQRKPFIRLAVVEVLIMAVTMGVAVSLSRIPPPLPAQLDLTRQDVLLGYTITEPPSLMAFITNFRFDLVFGVGALLLQAVYLWAYFTLKNRGVQWPMSRLLWWTGGNVLLLITTSSGLGMYAMAMFGPHMLQHMLLSMAIPIFWVLGGPMTLLLRALPPAGRDGVPGPREWLVVFINNPFSRFLTNPIVAGVQFVVGFYYLYLSPLFNWMAPQHGGHLFMMLHFIISGYIFYWVIIGVDAAPRQLSPFVKMMTLLAATAFHAWFGIAMMQMSQPLNEAFYESLGLPFEVDLMHQQLVGGGIAWAIGELPLIIVSIAHGVQWVRTDRRESERYDRKEARTGEQDLSSYNEMLAALAAGGENASLSQYYNAQYNQDEVQSAFHTAKYKRQHRHRNSPSQTDGAGGSKDS